MSKPELLITLAIACLTASPVGAQTDFFWSPFELNSGATNSDASVNFEQGSSGSLFLYFSTDGVNDTDMWVGAFLDIATSVDGVIEFTRAETFDFAIVNNGTPVSNRWLDSQGGGGSAGETGTVTSNFIDEYHAFMVTGGLGILEAHNGSDAFLDTGYDPSANAFLFGVVDFNVVGAPGSSVDLTIEIGKTMISQGDYCMECDGSFGGATIFVRSIPEPTFCNLCCCLAACFVLRRIR